MNDTNISQIELSTASSSNDEFSIGASVELIDLTVQAGDRVLLDGANVSFPAGKLALIVGCSGVGKTVLLKLLAGLIDRNDRQIRVQGAALIEGASALHGHSAIKTGKNAGKVGVVFQNFALFDEMSPLDNVRFAKHHARGKKSPSRRTAAGLLEELAVPRGVPTSALSGGQRQRLAIARTLAYDPEVIFYDEPTSGLDSATGRQVAALIRQTHDAHDKTSIVVTHDLEAFVEIADQVFLFDGRSRSLAEVPHEQWSSLREMLDPPQVETEKPTPSWTNQLKNGVVGVASMFGDFFIATSRAFEQTLAAPFRLPPLWKSPYWGVRYFFHYLRLVAGPSAWVYIALAGAIIGYVATYFTFEFLPYPKYTEPLLIEDLLNSIGFALYRVLVPVMATILIAARCGAAVASDVGGKAYGRQIDAMKTFGARPGGYLLTNIIWAFLLGTPLLVMLGYFAASAISLVVFTATHPEHGAHFWNLHFHRMLSAHGEFFYRGTTWMMAKTLVCAFGIGLIAYHRGAAAKTSPREVSGSITSTILWSTLYVLVVHFVFAFYEYK